MDYKLEIYGSLCATRTFTINGIVANKDDFGDQYDTDPYSAEAYSCGDMRFIPFDEPKEGVLERYGITKEEFDTIKWALESSLSFGRCGWCS